MEIIYRPIGIVNSPFKTCEAVPIQPSRAQPARGTIDIQPAYREGLADLDGFSRIILLYHFHRVDAVRLTVVPFLDRREHGLFATRAPVRPNPVGLSILTLEGVSDCQLAVSGLDIVDQTPVLDIKPYVPMFDSHPRARAGWLDAVKAEQMEITSDDRFAPDS